MITTKLYSQQFTVNVDIIDLNIKILVSDYNACMIPVKFYSQQYNEFEHT